MQRSLETMFLLLVTCQLLHCDTATDAPNVEADASTLSYARDIQPIWDEYCSRCHFRPVPALELSAERSWQDLSSGVSNWSECGAFVVPGQPEQSLLYFKLTGMAAPGTEIDPDCARPMPADWEGQGDTPLREIDPAAVERVRAWILAGAPNN